MTVFRVYVLERLFSPQRGRDLVWNGMMTQRSRGLYRGQPPEGGKDVLTSLLEGSHGVHRYIYLGNLILKKSQLNSFNLEIDCEEL